VILVATDANIKQGDVPWMVPIDTVGNDFCVLTPGVGFEDDRLQHRRPGELGDISRANSGESNREEDERL
jgi:hypothetical protein